MRAFKFFALMLFPVLMPFFAASQNGDEFIPLRNTSGSSESPEMPRGGETIPIRAYYNTETYCVNAFVNNSGNSVNVDIMNTVTGESVSYVISDSGWSVMPISGNEGLWSITFILISGDMYVGEFLI